MIQTYTSTNSAASIEEVFRQSGFFLNDVQRHKEDDMDRAGDLAPLWSELEREDLTPD